MYIIFLPATTILFLTIWKDRRDCAFKYFVKSSNYGPYIRNHEEKGDIYYVSYILWDVKLINETPI